MKATANSVQSACLIAALSYCAGAGAANAVGWQTRLNCASDYYAYCSKHAIGTPGVAQCMRANGQRLSKGCINALIADGEISKAEVEKQKAKIAAAKAGRKPADDKIAKAEAKETAAKAKAEPKAAVAQAAKAKPKPEREVVAALTPPKPKLVRTGRNPEAESVATLALDAAMYDALKNREAKFVVASDANVAAAVQSQTAQSAWPPAAVQAAPPPVAQGAPVETLSPRREVPVAAEAAPTIADARDAAPTSKPVSYPPGRMSLGGKTASDDDEAAADGPRWWDALVAALFGAEK